jgi:hypothetical protein
MITQAAISVGIKLSYGERIWEASIFSRLLLTKLGIIKYEPYKIF